MDNGPADGLRQLVPGGGGLLALLGIAVVAAVLANLINNLPAVLVLLPLTVPASLGRSPGWRRRAHGSRWPAAWRPIRSGPSW